MKKILVVLGISFAVILCACGLSIAYLAYRSNRLDMESKKYADIAIMAIVKDWSEEEAIQRASPELQKAVTREEMNRFFDIYRRLGKLKKYEGTIGQSNISFSLGHEKEITACYNASAEFEGGPANITIYLIKHDDTWQILRFNIDSKVFFE